MEESSVYRAILRKGLQRGLEAGRAATREEGQQIGLSTGKLVEARETVVRIGKHRLRTDPSAELLAYLDTIQDHERWIHLQDLAFDLQDWTELLPKP